VSVSRAHVRVGTALALLLVLAAALRFAGLSFGLRHPPHPDEQVFVESALGMLERRDLDHRFYEYPGLFPYILAGAFGAAPPAALEGAGAYRVARGVVAAFGVLSVALLYRLGREVAGPRAALLATALLAVSPVAVQNAHLVRPDVVLQAFFLLALLAFRRLGTPAGDLRGGAALGLAGAVKFSGIFLVPTFLAYRTLRPRAALGLARALAAAVLAFALASPYAVLHLPDFLRGAQTQLTYHYEENPERSLSYGHMLLAYLYVWWTALGPAGTVLSVLGLWAARRRRHAWVPLLLLPATAIAVLATSDIRHDRFLLPSLVVPFLLAGEGLVRGMAWVGRRRSWGALATAVGLATLLPLLESTSYLREITRPGTRDEAADWMASHLPPGARVLTRLELGLPPGRLEVFRVPALGTPLQIAAVDYVVPTHRDPMAPLEGLRLVHRIESPGRHNGPTISILEVPAERRPSLHLVSLDARWLSASANADRLAALTDGQAESWWHTDGPQGPGDFLAVRLPEPVTLFGVELDLPQDRFAARELLVETAGPDGGWRRAATVSGRAAVEHQVRPPHSQVFLLQPPVRTTGLRLVQTRNAARRWGVAELRLHAVPDPAP
jgi:hypothetical protein